MIERYRATGERLDKEVRNGPDLRIMYLTAWATEDGRIHFRPDIYDLDGHRLRPRPARAAGLAIAAVPLAFLRAHPAELRHALRVAVAVAAAYGVIKLLSLPQGWWAVITAILVVQTSVGGSFKAALDRLWGTIAGAIYGALVAVAIPHTTSIGLAAAIVVAILPLAYLAAVNAAFRVAPVTALIVLLPIYGHAGNPLVSAGERIFEIIIGNVVALAVTLIILPARAHGQLREAAARVARLNADLLDMLISGLFETGRPGLQAMHASIRAALKRSETAAEEAARERQMRVSDERDPEPVIRTLYRVRHDLVMIGRAAARPLPEKLRPALQAPLDAVRRDGSAMLRGIGASLESKSQGACTRQLSGFAQGSRRCARG